MATYTEPPASNILLLSSLKLLSHDTNGDHGHFDTLPLSDIEKKLKLHVPRSVPAERVSLLEIAGALENKYQSKPSGGGGGASAVGQGPPPTPGGATVSATRAGQPAVPSPAILEMLD